MRLLLYSLSIPLLMHCVSMHPYPCFMIHLQLVLTVTAIYASPIFLSYSYMLHSPKTQPIFVILLHNLHLPSLLLKSLIHIPALTLYHIQRRHHHNLSSGSPLILVFNTVEEAFIIYPYCQFIFNSCTTCSEYKQYPQKYWHT